MPTGPRSLSRMNRNLIERERRSQMKILFSKLFNVLPPHPTKMSVPELVEHATLFINQLQKRMEEPKQRKVQLEAEHIPPQAMKAETISPVIDITDLGSTMEVNLIAGRETKFALCDIISILEEEGAQVISARRKKFNSRRGVLGNLGVFDRDVSGASFESWNLSDECFRRGNKKHVDRVVVSEVDECLKFGKKIGITMNTEESLIAEKLAEMEKRDERGKSKRSSKA
ncbi:hypothetical protein REPUB_Repub01dG0099000 [Reevesia pubescens]